MKVNLELLAIEYVLTAKASDQARLFDILHRSAQLAIAEDGVAFKLNLHNPDSIALMDHKCDSGRGGRNFISAFFNCCVWVPAGGKEFFQYADRVTSFYRIVDALFRNADPLFAKGFEHV